MKIIEKGELPGKKQYQARCNSCKTLFEFFADEAKRQGDQREGDYLAIACPLNGCGYKVTISI